MRILVLFLVSCAWAGEYAVLNTGFRILADRYEKAGERVRLFTRDGVIEVPSSSILAFEPAESRPAPPAMAPEAAKLTAPEPAPLSPKQLVDEAALRNGLPPEFVHSVARVESAYRPDAVSPKGAIGVMQLMPATAAMLEADPRDPAQNVEAGTRHLRDLLIRYNGETRKALAAYNAGAGAVERYGGVPPYPETKMYVEKVLRLYQKLSSQAPPSGGN